MHNMIDLIIILIIAIILASAIFYIIKQKKQGVHCIGCEHAKQCQLQKCKCALDEYKNNKVWWYEYHHIFYYILNNIKCFKNKKMTKECLDIF